MLVLFLVLAANLFFVSHSCSASEFHIKNGMEFCPASPYSVDSVQASQDSLAQAHHLCNTSFGIVYVVAGVTCWAYNLHQRVKGNIKKAIPLVMAGLHLCYSMSLLSEQYSSDPSAFKPYSVTLAVVSSVATGVVCNSLMS